jgi:tetratricopeptide (TPR) repeat protein
LADDNLAKAGSDEPVSQERQTDSLPHEAVIRFDRGVGSAQVWMSAFLIIVVGVIAYSNILGIPFHTEDRALIVDNAPLHSVTTFPAAVDPEKPRVLTMLSFALNWEIAPGSSAAFHVVNLLLHLANAVLVFLVCRSLLGPAVTPVIAMLAGMLFAIHPLNTESVDYVVGRAGLLSTFFVLVSVWLFVKCRPETGSSRAPSAFGLRPGFLALSVFAYVFAWAVDGSAIVLPFIILAVDWVGGGRKEVRTAEGGCATAGGYATVATVATHGPFWGVLAILLAVQYAAGVSGVHLAGKQGSFAQLGLLSVLPLKLSVVHAASSSSAALLAIPVLVAVVALVLVAMRSVAGVGLAWFAIGLWCTGGTEVDEKSAYLGLAGLAMLVPWLLTLVKLPSVRVVAGLIATGLVVACGTGTHLRNMVWQDEASLWTDAAEKAPGSPVPPRNLGHAFLVLGEAMGQQQQALMVFQKAEENLRRSLSLDPENVQAKHDLAMAVLGQGRTDEAISLFLDILRLDLDSQSATLNLAILLNGKANAASDQKLLARSVDYFRRADMLKALSDESCAQYGMALLAMGEWEEAEGVLHRAAGIDSESPLAPVLKNVQDTAKRLRGMEQQSLTLLSKNPSDASGLKMRAQVYALRGHVLEAAYTLERLWREDQHDFDAWVLLSYVKAKMKEPDEFIKDYAPPPPKPEGVKSVWMEAARASASRGLWDAAKAYVESPGAAGEGLPHSLLSLGEIAVELRQPARAQDYFQQATIAYPNDPQPWLCLCDLATAGKANEAAERYLSEAKSRGADAGEAAKRQEKLGGGPVAPAAPGRTIIR